MIARHLFTTIWTLGSLVGAAVLEVLDRIGVL